MDSTTWLVSGLVPAAITFFACVAANRFSPRDDRGESTTTPSGGYSCGPLILAIGWAIAVIASLVGHRIVSGDESSLAWPDDFWQRGYWGVALAAVLLGATTVRTLADSGGRWVVAALILFATAAIGMPSGEGWEDMIPLHRGWMVLLGSSGLVGSWSLERMAVRRPTELRDCCGIDRWFPLVILATLAGPMFVAATTYGALVQWTLAAISATAVCVAFAAAGRLPGAVGIVYPSAVFAMVMVSAGRFYSYEDHPWWSYVGLLWVGPAVSFTDWLVVRWLAGRRPLVRMMVAATVSILMVAVSAGLQSVPSVD